jgi:hypothetical protein
MRIQSLIASLTAAAVLCLGVAGVPAGDEKGGSEEPAAAREEAAETETGNASRPPEAAADAQRFTNEDLPDPWPMDRPKRSEEPDAGQDAAAEEDEAEADLDEVMQPFEDAAVEQQLQETRKAIAMLENRLAHLQSRLKSVQNPFLKRLTPASQEEEDAVGGLSNVERLNWVKEQIAITEEALEEAHAELAGLLRR